MHSLWTILLVTESFSATVPVFLLHKYTLSIRDCNKVKITVSTQQEWSGKSSHYLPVPASEGLTLKCH